MTSLKQRLQISAARGVRLLRRNTEYMVPLVLIVVGVSMTFASLTPAESLAFADSFVGTLGPGNNTTLVLPPGESTYVLVNLSLVGCGIRLYPATMPEWDTFNRTGQLPGAWIGCGNGTTAASGDAVDLIVVNLDSGSSAYDIHVEAYQVTTPYAWISIPGAAMALAGLLLFVPRFVFREAMRWRDEWGYQKKK